MVDGWTDCAGYSESAFGNRVSKLNAKNKEARFEPPCSSLMSVSRREHHRLIFVNCNCRKAFVEGDIATDTDSPFQLHNR